jgi:competence protein ComEA
MAVVCWIGWFVPTSRQAEPLSPAAGFPVERGSSVPLRSKQSETPGHLSAERPMAPSSDQAARVTLDVNQATVQELEQLPGIGPVLAGRIVEDRKTRGAFRNVDHLRRVKGIGKKTFERIRAFIAVVPPVSMSGRKAA